MFRCAAATLCVFLAIPPALAIPEADHATRFERDVMPAYFQGQVQGYFSGVDDLPIHYVAFERDPSVAPGALVVVQGRGGSTIGDMELLYDLRQWGYAVYALDHRGQGQSGRMIEENHYKGHVERFQDYVDDLDTFLKRFVFPKGHHKVVVLATSMGGAVATIYAQQNPDTLDGLVLNVPMHLPYYAQFPEDAALAIGVWADLRDKDRQYAIGQDDPGEPEFYDNDGSQSRARFDAWVKLRGMFPEIDLGGPTYRWALESLKATRWSRAQAPRLVTPTFMLQAGKDRVLIHGRKREGHPLARGFAICLEIERRARRFLRSPIRHRQLVKGSTVAGQRRHRALLADELGLPPVPHQRAVAEDPHPVRAVGILHMHSNNSHGSDSTRGSAPVTRSPSKACMTGVWP